MISVLLMLIKCELLMIKFIDFVFKCCGEGDMSCVMYGFNYNLNY